MGLDLARAFQADIAIWLALTLVLGGAGAMATGRALARPCVGRPLRQQLQVREPAHDIGPFPGTVGIDHARPRQAQTPRALEPARDGGVLHMKQVETPDQRPKGEGKAGLLNLVGRCRAIAPTADMAQGAGQADGGAVGTAQAANGTNADARRAAEQGHILSGRAKPLREIERPGFDPALNMAEARTGNGDAR